MLKDISTSSFKSLYDSYDEFLTTETLSHCNDYFAIDLFNATAEEKIQWYKNLFWVTTDIDLGLSHAIQHNQSARNYAHYCTNTELSTKIFKSPWHETIGADVEAKPSSNVTIEKVTSGYLINGNVNWLTNLDVADYVTIPVFDNNNKRFKIIIDLQRIPHNINSSWSQSLGMKTAHPSSLVLDNVTISEDYCMGDYSYPNKFHYAETLNSIAFATNMLGNIVAMYREILDFVTTNNMQRDLHIIDLENDVFVALKKWLDRLEQFKNPKTLKLSETYWLEHLQLYMFGKKTLLKAISVSRLLGIQHQLVEGESSRVFRNALTFSSHMFKIQNYNNLWGDNSHNNINMDLYLKHTFNNLIFNTDIPETWQ